MLTKCQIGPPQLSGGWAGIRRREDVHETIISTSK